MKIKELVKTWYIDLIASGLGIALIIWSFSIKSDNHFGGLHLYQGFYLIFLFFISKF